MSKAEERALEKYPKKIEWIGNQWDGAPFDVNSESRVAYKQGYHQAEKDLTLTWEDINRIEIIIKDVYRDYPHGIEVKQFGVEVLNRFNKLKEK